MSVDDFLKQYPTPKIFREEMKKLRYFYKREPSDKIWWVNNAGKTGIWEFSFDKKKIYNMFRDYPWKLSKEEKEIFDKENPHWADFFKNRK